METNNMVLGELIDGLKTTASDHCLHRSRSIIKRITNQLPGLGSSRPRRSLRRIAYATTAAPPIEHGSIVLAGIERMSLMRNLIHSGLCCACSCPQHAGPVAEGIPLLTCIPRPLAHWITSRHVLVRMMSSVSCRPRPST